MTRKEIETRHAAAAAGQLHPPRPPRPTAMREHRAARRQERSRQERPVDASRPSAKAHQPFPVSDGGCSQGQWLGVRPAQTPPHISWLRQPALVARMHPCPRPRPCPISCNRAGL